MKILELKNKVYAIKYSLGLLVDYKKRQIMPTKMVLSAKEGKKIKINEQKKDQWRQ